MSSSSYLVHVDDTDPRFTFHGNWTTQHTTNSWGLSGPPFNLTLHQTASGGRVDFRFKNVAAVSLYGNINTSTNQPKPSWTCSLDGKLVGNNTEAPVRTMSHFPFCKLSIGDSGEHQLTMNVTVPLGGILAVDAISLTPAEGVTVSNGEIVQIDDVDPAVTYSSTSAWQSSSQTATHDTSTAGSFVQFNFTGSSVQFAAVYIASNTQSSGDYTIDGGPKKSFTIPEAVSTSYNNILLSEEGLAPTNHSLNVTFSGESTSAPLSLSYFLVTLPPGQSPLVSTAQIVEPPGETAAKKSSHAGAIAGGVIGGVVGLAIIVVAFILWRRYRGRQGKADSTTSVTPFMQNNAPEPVAFPSSPPMQTLSSESSVLNLGPGNSKPAPIVMSYEPRRVDIQHEDSGYRGSDQGPSRMEGDVEIREIPPVYSPV